MGLSRLEERPITPSPDRSVLGLPKAVSEFCVWTLLIQVLAEAGFAFLRQMTPEPRVMGISLRT